MRRWSIALFVLLCGGVLLSAQDQMPIPINSHSGSEPDHAKIYAAMDASTKASPPNLLTTGEKTSFNETAPYAEAIEIAHRLEQASPYVKVITYGTSPEGRPMIALIVSKDKAFTPEQAHRTNKAVILIQSGIHTGEIEGKDTALMLVRDMTVTKLHANWLDSCIFVVIPVFNVDGHDRFTAYHRTSQSGPYQTGTREDAELLNLNRDYVKADTPEMRAWLQLYTTWLPEFMFDNHVTDGSDWQYDVTWDMARNQDLAEPSRNWVAPYVVELDKRMAQDGHLVAPYGALRNVNGRREFFMEVFSPRYSHLYAAVENRPCLLIETHSWKLAKTRASANYDIMRNTIDIIAANPQPLRQAVRASDALMMSYAGDHNAPKVYLGGEVDPTQSEPLLFHALKTTQYQSEVTGTMVTRYLPDPDDFETVIHDKIKTTTEAQMPLGYVIPRQYKVIADELRLHNVEVDTIPTALTQNFETYRFTNVQYANSQFEGHVMVDFTTRPVTEKVTVAAGSFWVPMKQRSARLILQMLEPDAPDSLVKWGYIDQVLGGRGGGGGGGGRGGAGRGGRGGAGAAGAPAQAGRGTGPMPEGAYAMEPLARRMMANQPQLQKEFVDKVASDPAFAANPQARLQWWYDRSNYAPEDAGRYPVFRVWQKTW